MQRRIRPEDRVEQISRKIGVDMRSGFGDAAKADFALDRDQAADLPP